MSRPSDPSRLLDLRRRRLLQGAAALPALGLGGVNKLLEPYAGAVLAKISILGLIVLFVQKRPQGLFAPRGRSVE